MNIQLDSNEINQYKKQKLATIKSEILFFAVSIVSILLMGFLSYSGLIPNELDKKLQLLFGFAGFTWAVYHLFLIDSIFNFETVLLKNGIIRDNDSFIKDGKRFYYVRMKEEENSIAICLCDCN